MSMQVQSTIRITATGINDVSEALIIPVEALEPCIFPTCVVCEKPIEPSDWDDVKRIYPKVLKQVDLYGADSLTDRAQVLYNGNVHAGCFDLLE